MRIAISGSRKISQSDESLIHAEMAEAMTLYDVSDIFFGGARGVDTVALCAAFEIRESLKLRIRLNVIVPFTVSAQPVEARKVIAACADNILEMRGVGSDAYFDRNNELLRQADLLLAFWDGMSHGTKYTIETASRCGVDVYAVPLSAAQPLPNPPQSPQKAASGFYLPSCDIYTLGGYEHHTALTNLVYDVKSYHQSPILQSIAEAVTDALMCATPQGILIPVPRRLPGMVPSTMVLAQAVSRITHGAFIDGTGLLKRMEVPMGGHFSHKRWRYTAEEHAASMRTTTPRPDTRIILLDDVFTEGGTMNGASMRIHSDWGLKAIRFAVVVAAAAKKNLVS